MALIAEKVDLNKVGVNTSEELVPDKLRQFLHDRIDIIRLVHALQLYQPDHELAQLLVYVKVISFPRLIDGQFLVEGSLLVVVLLNDGRECSLQKGERGDANQHQ